MQAYYPDMVHISFFYADHLRSLNKYIFDLDIIYVEFSYGIAYK